MATAEQFSQEELLEHAQGNVTGFILATIAYVKQHGRSVEDWTTFVGRIFAPGWQEMRGRGARDVMRVAMLNAVSGGAQLESLSGDDTEARATIVNWPTQDMVQFFGLSQSEIGPFWSVFRPIADQLGFDYRYESQGDRHTFHLAKSEAEAAGTDS